MELIAIIVLAALIPILSITAFIVGYNINAPKKVFRIPKKTKTEKSEDELMLERIDKAKV